MQRKNIFSYAHPLLTHTHTQTHTHTHTHTHTKCTRTHTQVHRHKHYTDCHGEGQHSAKMLKEEKCLEFVFEGGERIRVSDILGEVVSDMRTEIGERAKAMGFAVEVSEFEYACV